MLRHNNDKNAQEKPAITDTWLGKNQKNMLLFNVLLTVKKPA